MSLTHPKGCCCNHPDRKSVDPSFVKATDLLSWCDTLLIQTESGTFFTPFVANANKLNA